MNRFVISFAVTIWLTLAGVSKAPCQWIAHQTGVNDALYGSFFIDSTCGYAVGWGNSSGGVILKTENSASTWDVRIPIQGSYLFDITFTDEATGYACGYAGNAVVLKTTDYGTNWTATHFPPCFGFYVVDFTSADTGFACGYDGKIARTTNAGDSWQAMSTGTNTLVFRWMHFANADTGYAVGGVSFAQPNMVYRSIDQGETWTVVHDFGNTASIGGMQFLDGTTGILVGNNGHEAIWRSTDAGETWDVVHSTNSSAVLQAVSIHESGIGWAVGGSGRTHHTTDFGQTWVFVASPTSQAFLTVATFNTVAYAGAGNGRVFRYEQLQSDVSFPNGEVIRSYQLLENFPNPFNAMTNFSFQIPVASNVRLTIFDATAREVATVVDGELPAGEHEVSFSAPPNMASGSYFAQLETGVDRQVQKITLLK